MLPETKIYSDFIKRNKIVVRLDCFIYNIMVSPTIVPLTKDDKGKWYAENEDSCYTKKAAVYYYLKNKTDLK
jgi:hypothetical protein